MTPSPLQCPRLNYFAPQADRAFAAAGGRPRNPWTPDEEAQAIHDDLVGENQIHKCAVAANGCKKTPDGPCKRHFDRFVVTQITSFDKKGRPVYRRPTEKDLNVVGYNRAMLLDWRAHMNVEAAMSAVAILYLYDYLFKGNKKAVAEALREANPDGSENADEIEAYLKGRLLCANDATARAFGHSNYPKNEPGCITIHVKSKKAVDYLLKEHKSCDMYGYLQSQQIPALKHLKFDEFYKFFHVDFKPPSSRRQLGVDYFEIRSPSNKPLYIYKYVHVIEHIVRIEMLYPSSGDLWFLRLIVRTRPVSSFEDALSWPPQGSPGSILYKTHQLAALAAGLLDDDEYNEAYLCLKEAVICADKTPKALRGLFAVLTLQGFVTVRVTKNRDMMEYLLQDWIIIENKTFPEAYRLFLLDLKKRLAYDNKTVEDFGLQYDPTTGDVYDLTSPTLVQEERERYPSEDQRRLYEDLLIRFPPNREQSHALETIKAALTAAKTGPSRQRFIQLHGAAGTGKTVVGQMAAAWNRAQGGLTGICCATTLACSNYKGAETAHHLFAYPVVEDDEEMDPDNPVECQLDKPKFSERLEFVNAVTLLIWDENLSNHAKQIEASVAATKANVSVVWLFIGDSRQILPIINRGSTQEIINATFTSSPLWLQTTVLYLTENKRLADLASSLSASSTAAERTDADNQRQYADAVLSIGDGRLTDNGFILSLCHEDQKHEVKQFIGLPHTMCYSLSDPTYLTQALTWMYPNGTTSAVDDTHEKCILAISNERVDFLNEEVQKMNPRELTELKSHDQFSDVDDPHGTLQQLLTETVLNNFTNHQVITTQPLNPLQPYPFRHVHTHPPYLLTLYVM